MIYYKTPKYKNTKIEYDSIKFDSILEFNVYKELKLQKIDFVLKPKYLLVPKFKLNGKTFREINYIADFDLKIDNKIYTIDAKGLETQVFKIKAKMFAKEYTREIITIKSIRDLREKISKIKNGEIY